jgi:hypothetical protein
MRNPCLTAFVLTICCFIAGPPCAEAQGFNNTSTHAIYTEVGGQGAFFSVNYDSRLTSRVDGLGFRVGVGYGVSSTPCYVSFPVGLNWLAGSGGNYFEFGAGATYINLTSVVPGSGVGFANKTWNSDQHFLCASTVIGYRRQPGDGHLSVRTGLAPLFGGGAVMLLPYLSLGWCF